MLGALIIAACGGNNPKPHPPKEDNRASSEMGSAIVKVAFKELSGKLQTAVKEKGAAAAVAFCNTVAIAVTDSIAKDKKVEIRRTSLQYRNPANAPSSYEQEQLNQYQSDFDAGRQLLPVVKQMENGGTIYMEPIIMMPFCLQCHGQPAEDVAAKLRELYPQDKAIGYKEGDFRGMWAVKLY